LLVNCTVVPWKGGVGDVAQLFLCGMFVWTGMAEGGQTRDQGITEFKTGPMERGRLGDDGSCSLSHLHHAGNGRRRRDCHLGQARGLGLQLNGWEMLTDCSPCFGLLWATQLKFFTARVWFDEGGGYARVTRWNGVEAARDRPGSQRHLGPSATLFRICL